MAVPRSPNQHGPERHTVNRIGWLRASVLGANDGIISTASLIMGIAGANSGRPAILVAGLAAMVAGAMSMAAGEYVSVSSQADSEKADLAREAAELKAHPDAELAELAGIYRKRGLDADLAQTVAEQLHRGDVLAVHAHDELGIVEGQRARPVQAAMASAIAFAAGAVVPLAAAWLTPLAMLSYAVVAAAMLTLPLLGVIGAHAGGAKPLPAAVRVSFWGAGAMAATYAIGHLLGTSIA
jgi:vacuolar iron transporter family protein